MPLYSNIDLTGTASSNRITDEIHASSESGNYGNLLIIPNYSPFFTSNLVVKQSTGVVGVNDVTLTEGTHYTLVFPYIYAIRHIGKALYGGIYLNNLDYSINSNTPIKITYQTIGGDAVVDKTAVLTKINNLDINIKTETWDVVSNKPVTFPPVDHTNSAYAFKDFPNLIEELNNIKAAIVNKTSDISSLFQAHLNGDNPHHLVKGDVNLGDTPNLSLASQQDITNENVTIDKLVTLKQVLELINNNK